MSRWFWAKAVLGGVGLVLGLVGMAFDFRPLVWVALVLLAAAFGARFAERREREDAPNQGS
jgi:membrane protein implicated in regulation of membrane protease activity